MQALLDAGASATSSSGRKPRETVLQAADKQLTRLRNDTLQARTFHDDDEKAKILNDLSKIKQLVQRAAEQREQQKSVKKASRQAKRNPVAIS